MITTNKVILNPTDYSQTYIKHINMCFENWGDQKEYDWTFNRKIGTLNSDILLLANENDEVIAGSGISYRNIKTKENKILKIGIFTGSWTLPAARGRGCFMQIIDQFILLCKERQVDYLTAFVTESNASARRFMAKGSYLMQADNVLSNIEISYPNCTNEIVVGNVDLDEFYSIYQNFIQNNPGFLYTKEEFAGQYITRIANLYKVSVLNNTFLIEENQTTVKILLYNNFDISSLKTISNWAHKTKTKKIMFFLTDENQIEQCRKNDFTVIKSFFTLNKINDSLEEAEVDFESFRINLADKM